MSSCNGVVLQPHPCRNMDGLGCSPFARHYWGNHCLFSFPAGTKMFQFPALASCYARCHSFRMTGCPIRKSSDQRLFAPTRSLSQLITSFIASESQGIRHAPLLTFFQTFYSHNGIDLGIASDCQYCILEHVRFDIYFQLLLLILLFVHHVKDRFSFQREWRITDSNR